MIHSIFSSTNFKDDFKNQESKSEVLLWSA